MCHRFVQEFDIFIYKTRELTQIGDKGQVIRTKIVSYKHFEFHNRKKKKHDFLMMVPRCSLFSNKDVGAHLYLS